MEGAEDSAGARFPQNAAVTLKREPTPAPVAGFWMEPSRERAVEWAPRGEPGVERDDGRLHLPAPGDAGALLE